MNTVPGLRRSGYRMNNYVSLTRYVEYVAAAEFPLQVETVRNEAAKGTRVAEVARISGLSRQSIHRIQADPEGTEKALASWGL